MILLEIALQGIRGFGALTRIPLRPGLNVGRTSDARVRRTLLDAIYHLVYADPSRSSVTSSLVDPSAEASRIGLTFFGRDQATYRIVRDAASGAVSLHKFDRTTQKYDALTRASQEVAQFLRVQQQLPDDVGYERLFVFAPEGRPSLASRARTRSGAPVASGEAEVAPSGPGLPRSRSAPPRPATRVPGRTGSTVAAPGDAGGIGSSMNMTNALVQAELSADLPSGGFVEDDSFGSSGLERAGLAGIGEEYTNPPRPVTTDQLRELVRKLRAERDALARAEQAQVELDRLTARRHAVAGKADRIKALRGEVENLRRLAATHADLQSLPQDFAERLRHFEEAEAKYQADRGKLGEERAEAERQISEHPVLKPTSDPYFLAGVGLSVVLVAIAVAADKPAIALLNLLSMAVAAGAAFRWVGDLEREARVKVKLAAITEREQRLERQYDLDTAALKRLMQNLAISDTHELLERLESAGRDAAELRSAEENLAAALDDPAVRAADQELAALTPRIEALEAEVLGASGTSGSVAALDRRIAQAERELMELDAFEPTSPGGGRAAFTGDLTSGDLQPPLRAASVVRPSSMPQARPASVVRPSAMPQPVLPSPPGGVVPSPRSSAPAQTRPGSVVRPAASSARPGSTVRSSTPSPAGAPARPANPARPVPPTAEAASLFDFGVVHLGEEDDEEGYGSGYGASGGPGGSSGPAGPGKKASAGDQPPGLWLAMGPGGGAGFGGRHGYGDGGGARPDRSRDLLQVVLDLVALPVDELGVKLAPRIGQYLEALTSGEYDTAELGPRGELLVAKKGGPSIAFPDLSGEAIDLVDAALRFSLIEAAAAFKIPVLFDDPFGGLDPKRRKMLGQMLGYVAQGTQVVFLTDRDDVAGTPIPL